jgi:class 3 adenylate cyclase
MANPAISALDKGHMMFAKPVLLVVDDVPDNIAVLANTLGSEYQVRIANSGARALRLCAEDPLPQLVLLDVMMPDLDGLEVCRRLKADPRTKDVPVILVTALADSADETRGFEAGAVDYVTKPISPSVVLQRVRLHLELQEARRRLEYLSGHYKAYLAPELSAGIQRGEVSELVASQRKGLSIFFSDIEGFTSRTERLGAEDMTVLLNAYFAQMTRIVRKYGGTLDKYIGDAMLVFFGDPVSHGPAADALACVQMALEIQEQLPLLNSAWRAHGLTDDLAVRIGITTGPCTVGNFGSQDQMSYTVLGTPVNAAARLQSHCPPGQVLVAEQTMELVREHFTWQAQSPLALKGLTESLRTYLATSPAAEPPGLAAPAAAATFVR